MQRTVASTFLRGAARGAAASAARRIMLLMLHAAGDEKNYKCCILGVATSRWV
jgi:hypothetical protein